MARAPERFDGRDDACATQVEAVIESVDDGLILCDGTGHILRMNRKAMELHGYACIEEAGQSTPESSAACELYTPDGASIPPANWPLNRALRGEAFADFPVRIRNKRTGAERTVRCRSTPHGDPQGNTGLTVLILQELDRHSQEAQRESESRLQSIFRAAPVGIGLVSNRVLLDVNDRLCEMVGYGREELIGRNAQMLYPTREEWEYVGREKYRQIRERGTGAVETRWRRKDGRVIDVLLSSTPLDPGDLSRGVTFTALDITERKQAETALREKEYLLSESQRIGHIGSWSMDLATGAVTWTHETYRLYGVSPESFVPAPEALIGLLHPADRQAMRDWIQAALAGERPDTREFRVVLPDGGVRILSGRGELVFDGGNEPRRLVGTAQDVTEQKRAEASLRELSRKDEEALRVACMAHWEFDMATGIFTFNDQYYNLHGTDVARAGGYRIAAEEFARGYVHPDDAHLMWDAIGKAATVDDPDFQFQTEARILRTDGEVRWVTVWFRIEKDAQGRTTTLHGVNQDITERRYAEEELRRLNEHLELLVAERTEDLTHTVARLQQLTWELSQIEDRERRRIADLLHDDVQQILAGARFHLNLLTIEARSPEYCREVVHQVRQMLKDAIEKARNLSHELSPALYQVDLTDILNWLGEHMRREHGLIVAVKAYGRINPSSEPLKALLYKVAQELLFNVVKHAEVLEATVRVRRIGQCICLSVTDRGRGFDPGELEQTAGFGLLSIRERISLLGGRMRIGSTPGMGSRFSIVLPDRGPLQPPA